MRTIVLTGGGTAGHVLPNLALVPELKKCFDRICYVGGRGIEKELAVQHGIEFFTITTVKLRRKFTLKNLLIPYKHWQGIREAKKILRHLNPNVIFSKGGFVALPVVYAAAALKIKIIAHESDLSLGLANRLTARKCTLLCSTLPLAPLKNVPIVQTGALIRSEIYQGNKTKIPLPDNGKPHVLVIGGSLGARALNQVVWQALRPLCTQYNVLHITGRNKSNQAMHHSNYRQIEYLERVADAYAWADVVVARSGAGTVSELLALKKPAIYIPLPKDESRGDQIQNAAFLKKLGVCAVIAQHELNTATLLTTLAMVYQQRQQISAQCARQTWIDGTQRVLSYLRQS